MSLTDDADRASADLPLSVRVHSDGAQPLHAAVSDLLRSNIESGRWPAHYKLRAEPDLAVALGVSRGTVRRAIQSLVDEGRLLRTHGRGTFVAAPEPEPAIAQELLSLSEALAQDGVTAHVDAVESSMGMPPAYVRGLLDLDERQPTLRLSRRYLVRSRPVWYLTSHLRTDLCPGIEHVDFTRQTVFQTFENDYGLTLSHSRRTFSAQAASQTVALALQLAQGSPVLHFEQVTYVGDGTPIEYSDVWVRSDRLKVSSVLARQQPSRPSTAQTTTVGRGA